MVHDLNPVLFKLYGDVGIRWYGLSYILGFIAAYMLMTWLGRRQKTGMTPDAAGDFITYIALGTIIGGRLGYCLFYAPDLFLKFKPDFPFWGVFAVNEGGMASHGGIIGIVIASILFARKTGLNLLYLFDLTAVSGPLGVIFGRIANFINGELVGRPAPADLPWAVKFPQDMYLWPKNEPQRLNDLATVVEKINIQGGQWLEWVQKMGSDPEARTQVFAGINKVISEIQNGNSAVKEALAPFLTPRHPSQLYAALLEGFFVFFFLFVLWRKPRRPGFIAGWFLVLYAFVRIVDEHFRMPDDHIGFQLFGLTRGQWLSIGMLAIGFICIFVWSRASGFVINGWARLSSIKIGRK